MVGNGPVSYNVDVVRSKCILRHRKTAASLPLWKYLIAFAYISRIPLNVPMFQRLLDVRLQVMVWDCPFFDWYTRLLTSLYDEVHLFICLYATAVILMVFTEDRFSWTKRSYCSGQSTSPLQFLGINTTEINTNKHNNPDRPKQVRQMSRGWIKGKTYGHRFQLSNLIPDILRFFFWCSSTASSGVTWEMPWSVPLK